MNQAASQNVGTPACLVYCHCAHAKVVPEATKQAVLAALAQSGRPFEAIADLCESSARKDPALPKLMAQPGVELIACHRRAVEWLMHAAGTKLPEQVTVHNMRTHSAADIIQALEPKKSEVVS
jgi:hypothetical protein